MAGEYIYTIEDLSKSYGPKKLFEGIYLSFYHKAKIGIVGENGSGKSTLLRIMAGVEKDFMGKAELKKGATLGYLPQEPRLDPSKTVREEVEEAFADIKKMLADYDKVSDSMGGDLSPEEMEKAGVSYTSIGR